MFGFSDIFVGKYKKIKGKHKNIQGGAPGWGGGVGGGGGGGGEPPHVFSYVFL